MGEIELVYEAFELPADPGLRMATYTAERGTPRCAALPQASASE